MNLNKSHINPRRESVQTPVRYRNGALLFAVTTIILAAELVMPIVSARVNAAIVMLLLVLNTFIIINNIGLDKFGSLCLRFLPVFTISLVTIFFQGGSFIKSFFVFYKFFIWTIIIWYTVQSGNKKLAKGLLMAIVVFYVTTIITTQIGINLYPGICRALTNATEKDNTVMSLAKQYNIGGFSFIYTIVLLIPLGVYLFKNKLFNRILVGCIVAMMVLMVLNAGFTTAILFTALSAILFLLEKSFSIKKLIGIAIVALILILPSMNVVGGLLMNLSDNIENRTVALRLYDLGASFKGEETGKNSDLDGRIEHYSEDINNFIEHPLLGSLTSTGHSFVLDNISLYGLLGIIFLIIVFSSLYRCYIRPYKFSIAYGYLFVVFILQVGLAVLNPLLYLEVFVIVIPLMLYVFEDIKLPY